MFSRGLSEDAPAYCCGWEQWSFWSEARSSYEIKCVNFLVSEAIGILGGVLVMLLGAAIAIRANLMGLTFTLKSAQKCVRFSYLTMRLLLIFAAVLLTLSPLARAQAGTSQASGNGRTVAVAPSAAEIQSFAGCYELHVGRWWPWGFVWHEANGGLPRRIELLTDRGTERFQTSSPLMYAIHPEKRDSRSLELSFWAVQSAKKVRVVWRGHVADTLNLHKTRSGLSGWDHHFADGFPLNPLIAHATARRIPCVSSQLKE